MSESNHWLNNNLGCRTEKTDEIGGMTIETHGGERSLEDHFNREGKRDRGDVDG